MLKLSETSKAILLFLYVLLSSAIIIGIVRHISSDFHTFQIVFFYNLFSLVFFLPWVLRTGKKAFEANNVRMLSIRAVLEFVSFSLSFYAVTQIPLPQHTALLFTTPIFGTLLAITLLGERPGPTTFLCIAAGFAGVLLITRPGFADFDPGIVFALCAAIGFALCGNTIKILTRTDSSKTIAFYMLLMSTLISAPFGLLPLVSEQLGVAQQFTLPILGETILHHWQAPTLNQWGWFAMIGWLGYSQQLAVAAAFSKAPYTTIIPFNFAQLVFVSIIAYLAFGQLVDLYTVIGSIVIIAGTLYNAYFSTKRLSQAAAL